MKNFFSTISLNLIYDMRECNVQGHLEETVFNGMKEQKYVQSQYSTSGYRIVNINLNIGNILKQFFL